MLQTTCLFQTYKHTTIQLYNYITIKESIILIYYINCIVKWREIVCVLFNIQMNQTRKFYIYILMMSNNQKSKVAAQSPEQIQQILDQIDAQTDSGLDQLTNLIKSIPPQSQYLKTIKKLLIKYGAPITIFLHSFYNKITQQIKQQNIEHFQALAGIVSEMIQRAKIPQIQFIFQFGQKDYMKKISKSAGQLSFINFFAHIGKIAQQISNNTAYISAQQYLTKIQNYKNTHQPTSLMLRAIEQFHTLTPTIQNLLNPNLKNQSPENEQQQEFHDYYQFQESTKNTTISMISNLSYSMQNSIDVSMMKQKRSLCCRPFVIEGEVITDQDDRITTFLQIKYPFSSDNKTEIQRAICSFLNCEGGKIYLGVEKNEKGRRIVMPHIYNENQKEQMLKQFRKMIQQIDDQIIIQNMYSVEFIPIKQKDGQYILGAHIVRITVKYGKMDQLYCYEKDDIARFPFKMQSEIIERQGKQLIKFYKNRLRNPIEPQKMHYCVKPDIGELLYENTDRTKAKKKQKQKQQKTQIKKQEKQKQNKSYQQAEKMNESELSTNASISKTSEEEKTKFSYFFVVGLSQKNLAPIFQAKGVSNNCKIQAIKDQNKLIIRVNDISVTEVVRKILKKIQQKYKEKRIKVNEMSLIIETQRLGEALEQLKKINSKFQIIQNRIKFKLFRESFQAFNCLEAYKIPVKFIFPKD